MEQALIVGIPAAITLAGALIGHGIKARADAVAGYAALVKDLQAELARVRERLTEVETTMRSERDAWRKERIGLLARIKELEARLAELQAAEMHEEEE
ncbi:MAG: hypothetical protein GX657_15540 [Chloroflexi bacterium]|jgi:uncharacterized coiled-coil protein SlyX|nr:hypothetical protein [Chloroflexota bacterium]